MPDTPFQQDLKITTSYYSSSEKATLSITPTGDLQLIAGTEKLSVQLLRAVVNDQSLHRELLNQKNFSSRTLTTLLNLVLRRFKQNQIDDVKKSDSSFSGYAISRRSAGTNEAYTQISQDSVIWKFVDEDLENGTEYDYGFAKIYNSIFQTSFSDKLTVTPSAHSSKQLTQIGKDVIAIPGNREVTFYVGFNKKYKGSELLEEIVGLNVLQSETEPRQFTISIKVKDHRGLPVDLAIERLRIR